MRLIHHAAAGGRSVRFFCVGGELRPYSAGVVPCNKLTYQATRLERSVVDPVPRGGGDIDVAVVL